MNPPRALSFASQSLSRLSLVFFRFAIGIGLLAGPALSAVHAAPLFGGRPAVRAVELDSASRPKTTPVPGGDLTLNKEGERRAEALAAFARGLVAEDDGDFEAAFQAYRRSLAADPNNTELAAKVAYELARRGEIAEGIELLKDAAKAAPRDALPPLCLSQIYGKFLKKPVLAIKNASLALELDPQSIGPYAALVELYTEGDQPKKAAAIVERAMKVESADGDFWEQLAGLCTRLELKADGTVSPEKIQRITALFQKALSCDPKNPEHMVKAADFYFQTKQYESAIPLYRKALATEEASDAEDALPLRDKLARALMDAGHRDQALEVLQKIVDEDPQQKEAHALIGDIHLLEGRLEKALAAYSEVIRLNPSFAPAYLQIADLQMRLGQADKAIETLTDARKKFPGTALITYSLAATLSQAHRYSQALPIFEETLREAPASKPNLPDASFYFAYGMAAEQAGEIDRAVTLLQKSIALAPKDCAQACNYLGYLWAERGVHLPEAGELIQRALAQDPKNGAYLDSLGWYYYKIADFPKAIDNLLKATAVLPEPDPVVCEHLGDAYAAAGQTAKALEAWEKALGLDPTNKKLPAKIEGGKMKLNF